MRSRLAVELASALDRRLSLIIRHGFQEAHHQVDTHNIARLNNAHRFVDVAISVDIQTIHLAIRRFLLPWLHATSLAQASPLDPGRYRILEPSSLSVLLLVFDPAHSNYHSSLVSLRCPVISINGYTHLIRIACSFALLTEWTGLIGLRLPGVDAS